MSRCLVTSTSLHQDLLGAPGLLSGDNPRVKDKGRMLEWDPFFSPSPLCPLHQNQEYWECKVQ